jgi:hypothetical protein
MIERVSMGFVFQTDTKQNITINTLPDSQNGYLISVINPDDTFHAIELSRLDLKRIHQALEFLIWGTARESRP